MTPTELRDAMKGFRLEFGTDGLRWTLTNRVTGFAIHGDLGMLEAMETACAIAQRITPKAAPNPAPSRAANPQPTEQLALFA